MTVSIIIAVKTWQKNLEECVGKCLELDYPDFEILILPDNSKQFPNQSRNCFASNRERGTGDMKESIPLSIIPTGSVTPARKRDIGINHAKGEILAFIDDDAYPEKNWLKNALKNFADPEVAAVGGPAITPSGDNLRQKASGMVYSSSLVSGNYTYRYQPKNKREVDDYPSCNFLVRKLIMQELGGFQTNFWPGEDTKLCLDITKRLGKKIIYDPAVLVYHHRRPLFFPHLKQVASYALHRGYFAKMYPQTSFRLAYFIPTLFLFTIVSGGLLSIWLAPLRRFYLWAVTLYFLLVLIFSIYKELRLTSLVFFGITFTHLTYGLWFLKGLFSRRLREEE